MNLADNLKKIRKENNLSQEQLAEKIGVSRQSVSKWESNQAYPEMDKVLQICKMFNLNIDELLNQDIREVSDVKQNKINISKYVDEIFDYITKTIDMFSSMNFREKFKCIFEQLCIFIALLVVFLIIGSIGGSVVWSLLSFLPSDIYYVIYNIFEAIYLVVCLVVGLALFLHVFKVRYLDYYVIVKDDNDENKKEEEKIYLEKRSEKIIIRDPKHTGYRFIGGLLKGSLFGVKLISMLVCIGFCFSLVGFVVALVLSFLLSDSGILFIGCLITFVSCIFINIIILNILYNFIVSGKIKKNKLALIFVVSLIIFGVGCSFITIGSTNINYLSDVSKSSNYVREEKIIKMTDSLMIDVRYLDDVNYIESDISDVKIEVWYSKFYDIDIKDYQSDNKYLIHWNSNDGYIFKLFRTYVSDINNLEFVDYSKIKVNIYASKDNISKLQENLHNYEMVKYESQWEERYDNLQQEINRLNDEISKRNEKIYELEEENRILKSYKE